MSTCVQKKVAFRCVGCGRDYSFGLHLRCEECGSLVDPVYGHDVAIREFSNNPFIRYFDLLPLQGIDPDAAPAPGNTPCFHAAELSEVHEFGGLFLKNESIHPTGTTKDRMAACVLAMFADLGVRDFVASSTGNSSTAFAFGVQMNPAMHVHLFCGHEFVSRHAHCEHPQVTLHVINGDYVTTSKVARKFAEQNHILFESGFFNPARREGLKLAYLEAFDQMPEEPDVIVQAVSSGMGVYGAYRGIREYQRMGRMRRTPRIVCVQQDTCAPMVRAYSEGSPTIEARHIIANPTGIAEAILRGDPTQTYPYLFRLVAETNGTFCEVSQGQIVEAWHTLAELYDIDADYAAAAALAGTIALRRRGWIGPSETVLVNITGGRRPAAPVREAAAARMADSTAAQ
jgi:threonine synthase